MTATANYTKILRSDFQAWDGREKTGSKRDFTGGRTIGLKINNYVDVLQAYGQGTNRTYGTLSSAVVQVGEANVEFEIAPGTWTITSNLTIPSNISLRFPKGAVLDVASGITLTLNCGIVAGLNQIFSGAGTFAGTPVVDRFFPEWFGAKRDGSTDDQAAINTVSTLASTANGEVYFSAGTYIIGTVITARSNVHFTGAGAIAIIKIEASSNIDAFTSAATLSDLQFSNFKIDGNKANNTSNGTAILLSGQNTGLRIVGMDFLNMDEHGISLAGATTTATFIQGNYFSLIEEDAIVIDGGHKGTIIDGNYISGCQDGFVFKNTNTYCKVTNNHIEAASAIGIDVQTGESRIQIMGNTILDCITYGIKCVASSANTNFRSTISNNLINGETATAAIYVNNYDAVKIVSNTVISITGGSDGSIHLKVVLDAVVNDNMIWRNNGDGIHLQGVVEATVSSNVIIGDGSSTDRGIAVGTGTNTGIIISSNRCENFDGSGGDGIEVTSSANNTFITITNNDLRGNANALTIGASATDLLIHNNRLGTTLNTFVTQGIIES